MPRGRPPREPKLQFVCEVCRQSFERYGWENTDKKYCSRECFGQSRVGKANPRVVVPEEKLCKHCGKPFLVGGVGNRHRNIVYCSKTCARTAMWAESGGAHAPAREMSELERAWFAGLFDGEGCIAWPRRGIHRSVRLDVPNTCRALIDQIAKVTGTGRVAPYQRKDPKHSACWGWHCYGDNARSILRQIYPWLIVKKDAAAVALGLVEVTEPPWTQRTRSTRSAQ
jgi:hypothetical protein